MKKILLNTILLFVGFTNIFGQVLEVTHQTNGTTLSIPIESIDSVKFQLVPPPILKTIYQNNGNILGLSVNDIDSITYNNPNMVNLPLLTTSQPVALSPTTAYGGGTISSEGAAPVTQRGVCWSTFPNPTLANNYTIDGSGLGTFNSSVFPLLPSTTYYIRAYATNSFGTAYGNSFSIATSNPSGVGSIPTVTTSNVNYTDGLTAICGGNITADGGLAVIARGVCWAIGTTPTINNSFTLDGAGAGSFNSTITNLLPNTNYFVRAYATNNAGTSYGVTYSMTTFGLPSVTTFSVSNISAGSANAAGTVNNDGGSTVTSRGFCWSTNTTPTTNDNIISIGSGIGSYNGTAQILLLGTTYYLRAFATNGIGTSYGNIISFTTTGSVVNGVGITFDGYTYNTIIYGNGQEWMAENLRTTVYANGDPIPNVTDVSQWANLSNGAWAHYNDDIQYENPYGKLYNWFAVSDTRNVCPIGWHVPNNSEWVVLSDYLGGANIAGGKMKSTGAQNWLSPNSCATNDSDFFGLPGGSRYGYNSNSVFSWLGTQGYWWSSTEDSNLSYAYYFSLKYNQCQSTTNVEFKRFGLSIRCLKD